MKKVACSRRNLLRSRLSSIAKRSLIAVGLIWIAGSEPRRALAATESRPNILVILADDLGYGDVQCYNPERGKILTPSIDRLAREGIMFTDAHTSSGVCSPTRYTLLTGRYHWRTRLQTGIISYLERPLIADDRLTLAKLMKKHGYRTGMVGKWHLGWNWNIPNGERDLFAPPRGTKPVATHEHLAAWKKIYSEPVSGGPLAAGFDQYFGTDVPNWPPYSFFENDRVSAIPTTFLPPGQLTNKLASLPGPAVDGWDLEAILPALTERVCRMIRDAKSHPEPFFIYMPLTSPHTPIAVADEWKGRSGLTPYADFVMQTDATVGRVLDELRQQQLDKNTIVVFTSDNGCSTVADIPALQALGHYPSGPLRGHKAQAWEGGHRVPFIVRWPGVTTPNTRCGQLVQQADLMATFADILGYELRENEGEDSFSLLPLWKGQNAPVREYAVSHSSAGLPAFRKGNWKILFGPPEQPGAGKAAKSKTKSGAASGQLYDLGKDLGESKNLWFENPELVKELTDTMTEIVDNGRITPGPKQKNDVPVPWWRFMPELMKP